MSLFRFKEFTLQQADSAAKLTTDATIMGAWLPLPPAAKLALEVGSGTGILSLMLAQRSNLQIEALEIEEKAFQEACFNFENSPWKNQLSALHQDFIIFNPPKKYDLIFSNPPFFTNNLQSAINQKKNIAYHTESLSFEQLAGGIDKLLHQNGKAFVMLPEYEMKLFERIMTDLHFFVQHKLYIHHNPKKRALRVVGGFCRKPLEEGKIEKLFIRDENNQFHSAYEQLLTPFLTIF